MDFELAVIIPVYNEGTAIAKNFDIIYRTLADDGLRCSYILVDDGSKDNTWQELTKLESMYDNVRILRFARNFGKELAVCAGLDNIDADRFLVMDSDLQHPPSHIKKMAELMDSTGADIVNGIKASRGKERISSRITAKVFYGLLKRITGLDMDNSSDFKLLKSGAVEALRSFDERNLFFRGLVDWVGFKQVDYSFEVEERSDGASGFSTAKLFVLALNAIVSHTSKPLYLTVLAGVLFFVAALTLGAQTLINYFTGRAVSGFTTVIMLLLIIGSAIMISLGIIGMYISRIYDEVKGRPRYIISEARGKKDE